MRPRVSEGIIRGSGKEVGKGGPGTEGRGYIVIILLKITFLLMLFFFSALVIDWIVYMGARIIEVAC